MCTSYHAPIVGGVVIWQFLRCSFRPFFFSSCLPFLLFCVQMRAQARPPMNPHGPFAMSLSPSNVSKERVCVGGGYCVRGRGGECNVCQWMRMCANVRTCYHAFGTYSGYQDRTGLAGRTRRVSTLYEEQLRDLCVPFLSFFLPHLGNTSTLNLPFPSCL